MALDSPKIFTQARFLFIIAILYPAQRFLPQKENKG
jgi:hypothetical protein